MLFWVAAIYLFIKDPSFLHSQIWFLTILLAFTTVISLSAVVVVNRLTWGRVSETENALKDTRKLFESFMAHLPAVAFIKDRSGRYLYVNDACRELWRIAPDDMIGQADVDIWPGAVAERIGRHEQQMLTDSQAHNTVEEIQFEDQLRYNLFTRFPIVTKDRQVCLLAGIAFDITEKIQAEEDKVALEAQLIQTQKMEAIGTLAGGIAHDFNNVLAAILGYVELARLDAPSNSKFKSHLKKILKATHRAKELVRQILTFSRKSTQDWQALDPIPVIGETLKMLRAILPATVKIQTDFNLRGAQVLADSTQLQQVVMNLCTNAAHAMDGEGGLLSVSLNKTALAGEKAESLGLSAGGYIKLSVSDTGHGMSSDLQRRIFDPYFTTKELGKGTGMGLAMVRDIVESANGAIQVRSDLGNGTAFHIFIPEAAEGGPKSHEWMERLQTGQESVLFVDDEPFLVDLGKQMLTRLGYHVVACDRSTTALKLVREDPDRFDLVITDLTMPDMTGDILAEQLGHLRTDLPVIMCSGYSEQMTSQKENRAGVAAYVMKPLTIGDLARAVREVLDQSSGLGVARTISDIYRTSPN